MVFYRRKSDLKSRRIGIIARLFGWRVSDIELATSNMKNIHPSAIVDPGSEIGEDVEIGPFCTVGPHAKIGAGTRLENNVTLMGHVTLGCDNHVYPGAVLGGEPQDISYGGTDTKVLIGERNIIREGVTVNRASEKEDGVTRVGDDNFLINSVAMPSQFELVKKQVEENRRKMQEQREKELEDRYKKEKEEEAKPKKPVVKEIAEKVITQEEVT